MGEEVEKRGGRGIFYCSWGKNIILEKGGGVKITYFGQYIHHSFLIFF